MRIQLQAADESFKGQEEDKLEKFFGKKFKELQEQGRSTADIATLCGISRDRVEDYINRARTG